MPSVVRLSVAVVDEAPVETGIVPSVVPPSAKVTVPKMGSRAVPGAATTMVAMMATDCPNTGAGGFAATVTWACALLTFCVTVPLLGWKVLSPS